MLIRKISDVSSSEITPQDLYLNRRKFLAGTAIAGAAVVTGLGIKELLAPSMRASAGQKIDGIQKSQFSTTEKITPFNDVTHYNNYYEFSTEKEEPASLAKDFKTRPWTVKIDGAVKKKLELDIDSVIKLATPEERIYRHRCVEGWSIVVPWVGYSLNELIKKAEPLGKAKYVEFTTKYAPNEMPGQRREVLLGYSSDGMTPAVARQELQVILVDVRRGDWKRFATPVECRLSLHMERYF